MYFLIYNRYTALANVDSTTYQVTYQLKVFTTAIFFVIMLKKRLHIMQWFSLILLMIGITLVKPEGKTDVKNEEQKYWLGLLCLIISAISSGFAGVYFEKLLKESKYFMLFI